MEIRTKIGPAVLKHILAYDAETGLLTWKERGSEWFCATDRTAEHQAALWNSRHAGHPTCAAKTKKGYLRGTVLGRHYLAHMIIFALQTGEWALSEIDHINGNRSDNRWENLRLADRHGNCRNRTANASSSSKFKGVSWNSKMNAWRAQIAIKGTNTHIGYFDSEISAAKAYDARAAVIHGEYFRSNFKELCDV